MRGKAADREVSGKGKVIVREELHLDSETGSVGKMSGGEGVGFVPSGVVIRNVVAEGVRAGYSSRVRGGRRGGFNERRFCEKGTKRGTRLKGSCRTVLKLGRIAELSREGSPVGGCCSQGIGLVL